MKQFFKILLKILLRTVGTLSILVGLVSTYTAFRDFGNVKFGRTFDLLIEVVLPSAALGYFLFRVAAIEEWSWKLFWRIVLKALGTLSIIIGLVMTYGAYHDFQDKSDGFKIFFLCTIVLLPVAFGYLMLSFAADKEDTAAEVQSARVQVHKLGIGLILIFLLNIAVYMPVTGRVVVAVLLMLIFARVHSGWSSRQFLTPLGRISYAAVFDFVVRGTLCVTGEVLFALLTGGISGGSFSGGKGGSTGGGGASGSW
jgi:hypothetical protein